MPYRTDTWPIKEEDVSMVRCMCNVRPENRVSAEELRTGLKLNSVRKCLQY